MEVRHVLRVCPGCGQDSSLDVDAEHYFQWTINEILIQDAFPELDEDEREQLLTGFHKPCLENLLSDPEKY